MKYTIRPATRFDALNIASRLRAEDAREIRSASGRDPGELLPECVSVGHNFLLEVEGRMLALYGVRSMYESGHVGIPWLVATPLIKHHQFYFLRRFSRQTINYFMIGGLGYHTLINCVDARNELHIKWLKWCGFTITKLHPEWGADKLPFYQFEKLTHV